MIQPTPVLKGEGFVASALLTAHGRVLDRWCVFEMPRIIAPSRPQVAMNAPPLRGGRRLANLMIGQELRNYPLAFYPSSAK